MNPTVPQNIVDSAYEEDPASAAGEYGAEFRSDVEAFVSQEAVDTCVVPASTTSSVTDTLANGRGNNS
jgi:hypothetical protein